VGFVCVFDDELLYAIRGDTNTAGAYKAGKPDPAFIIDSKPVRESAISEGELSWPRSEPSSAALDRISRRQKASNVYSPTQSELVTAYPAAAEKC